MTLTAYDWQEKDREELGRNNWTGALIIEAGGGKSIAAALAVKDSGAEVVLIIAPMSTHFSAWAPTLLDVTGRSIKVLGNGNKAQREALVEFELGIPGIYITTPQFFGRKSTDTSMWRGDMIIVDEHHQVATAGSSAQRKLGSYNSDDIFEPIAPKFTHRLALSGTPMRQNFQNMWAMMRFLWPERSTRDEVAYSNYYVWCKDRMDSQSIPLEWAWVPITDKKPAPEGARVNRIGGVMSWMKITKDATKYLVESEPGKLVSEMPCSIIHKRRERCCEYHPNGFLTTEEPQVLEHVVELTAKQKKAIKELEEHYMTYIEDNPFVVELTMTQKARIRQVCLGEPIVEFYIGTNKDGEPVEKTRLDFAEDTVSPFLNETLEILEKLPDDETVLVFLESQRFASVLTKRLNKAGYKTAEYSGVTKPDLDRFGKDYRILVGVTSAIGTGTAGLNKVCQTEIWLEEPVSITMGTQARARLDRMGSDAQVQRYVVKDSLGYAEGRISENVMKQLNVNASLRKVVV